MPTKWLVDPPREGALRWLLPWPTCIRTHHWVPDWVAPKRIVYVFNPASLARDAGLLVHQAGYRCVAAGAVNMFCHRPRGKHGGVRKKSLIRFVRVGRCARSAVAAAWAGPDGLRPVRGP